jgi:hypothetical protein
MNTQFSVPKPCHENWDAMTPEEKGRFCSVCSKTVTDFTQMSNEQIVIYLRQNSGSRVCGRFTNDQLEEKVFIHIPRKVLYSQTKFINMFLLALLVSMGSVLFSCKNNPPDVVGELAYEADTTAVAKDTTYLKGEVERHPDENMGHTTGIVSCNDSIPVPPPPSIPVHKAPKSSIEDVKIK